SESHNIAKTLSVGKGIKRMEKELESKKLSQQETKPSGSDHFNWITTQLLAIAVAKGQVYEPERLRINASDLMDLSREQLVVAFTKARRELTYLPQVSEIRQLAQ